MKKLSFATLLAVLVIASCKKNDSSAGLSDKIQNIIADSVVKAFESRGLVVNRGNKPPVIEGIFLASPLELLSPYGPDDGYKKGQIVDDILYNIYDQAGNEAKIDYKSVTGNNTAEGLGTFISGSGNKFTLFAQSVGKAYDIPYKLVSVTSGEIAPDGIKNLQTALVLTEKEGDDLNFRLMPEGKGRIYFDNDKLAVKKNSYDFSASINGRNNISASMISK